MRRLTVKLKGIPLIVTGEGDGYQFDIDSIELVNDDDLTELILMTSNDINDVVCQEAAEQAEEMRNGSYYSSCD